VATSSAFKTSGHHSESGQACYDSRSTKYFYQIGIELKSSTSNNHLVIPQGQIFTTVADRPRLIIDKNNIFVAAFSKADDVATDSWLELISVLSL